MRLPSHQQISIALGALQRDDDGISCYRDRILHENGLDWRAVTWEPRNGVFPLRVQDIRAGLLGVAFDPIPESGDGHPRDAAHSLIVDCGLPKRSNKAEQGRDVGQERRERRVETGVCSHDICLSWMFWVPTCPAASPQAAIWLVVRTVPVRVCGSHK